MAHNPHAPKPGLTEGPIFKTLFFFTLPVLFGNVLQSLNGSVNAMWVGHFLGEAALTATSNANTIMFFLIATIFGVGMATSILVGQSVGAKNLDQAKKVVGTSVMFFAILAISVAVIGLTLAKEMMVWMRTPDDALAFAVAYMRVIFVAVPFLFANAFFMMILRGTGDSKTPFYFMLASVGLDIILNPLLIFGWGPVPRFGIAGSATATLIGQVLTLAALIFYLYRIDHFLCFHRGDGRYLKMDRAILKALIFKGLPMGLQMILVSLSLIIMISLVNKFGSRYSAAYGACLQLWNYVQMPAMAVGMSVSSMASQNVGAGRWDRVSSVARAGVLFNLAMTGTLVLLIAILQGPILGIFLPDPASIALGEHMNTIVCWSFILFGISFVLSGVMRSTGAVIAPLIILFVSLWLVRVPFALVFMQFWHEDAVWWSFPAGSAASMCLSFAYFRWGGWRRARMIAPSKPEVINQNAASVIPAPSPTASLPPTTPVEEMR